MSTHDANPCRQSYSICFSPPSREKYTTGKETPTRRFT
nr:MAG TPA: hypothetical protein [Siphoviridae sp. ctAeS79]